MLPKRTKRASNPRRRCFLSVDEISPRATLASLYQYDPRLPFQYRVPSHHLLLIVSGHIAARTPYENFEAKSGDLICFRPTDQNEYTVLEPTLYYQLHVEFAPPPRHRCTPHFGDLGPLPMHLALGPVFEDMRNLFEIFCLEITKKGALPQLRMRTAAFEMLSLIAGVVASDDGRGPHRLDLWQRVHMRMEGECKAEFDFDALASQMNLSRSHFDRAFKQRFGLTPTVYHIHIRLRRAVRLLRWTDKSIKEIAYEMGFPLPKLFTRIFKRHLGVTPTEIRQGGMPKKTIFASPESVLLPVNTILLPPGSGPNWHNRFRRR